MVNRDVNLVIRARDEARGVLDSITQAADRFTGSQQKLQQESRDSASILDQFGTALAELSSRFRGLSGSEAITQEVERSRSAIDRLEKEVRDAATAAERYDNELREARQETGLFTAEVSRLNVALKRQEGVIREVQEQRRRLVATSTRSVRTTQRYREEAVQLDAVLKAERQTLRNIRTELGATNGALRELSNNQNRIETSSRKAAVALQRNESALEMARVEYSAVRSAASGAATAIDRLGRSARGPFLRAFGEQARRLKETRVEFEANSREAQRLSRRLREVAAPNFQLVQAFERTRAAAASGRQEFRRQQRVLEQMRGVLRETGGGVQAFADRQARLGGLLRQGREGFQAYSASARQAAVANARLARNQLEGQIRTRLLGNETTRLSRATRSAARNSGRFAAAIRRVYGDSRQALSLTQRWRGEVLSLIQAYAGFFAVIQGLRGVIDAQRVLEGVTNRLSVAYEQFGPSVAQNFDFLRRTARRLGVSFAVLGQEFSKFAIAVQGTNLEGEKARRIFTQVSEAARVNNTTLDDFAGIFVALTQIVSKGVVSMEEVRQQLGDRIPGAVNILADSLGLATGELFKLIESGQLSSDVLEQFAEELSRRTGPQLEASLQSTTAAIGRFQNAVFELFARVGTQGSEGLQRFFDSLTETFQSAQFLSFLDRFTVGLGTLLDLVAGLVANFDLLAIALGTLIGFKLAPLIAVIVSYFVRWRAVVRLTRIQLSGLRASAAGAAAGLTAATTATRRFTLALRTLLSSTGIGLLVTAIGAAIGGWIASTEEATDVLTTHKNLVDEVRDAYDKVGNSVAAIRDELEAATATAARQNLQALTDQFDEVLERIRTQIGRTISSRQFRRSILATGFLRQVRLQIDSFSEGRISADLLRERVDDLTESFRESSPEIVKHAQSLLGEIETLNRLSTSIGEARNILTGVIGENDEATEAFDNLGKSVDQLDGALDDGAERLQKYQEGLEKLRASIPSLRGQFALLREQTRLKEQFDALLELAEGFVEVTNATGAYNQALRELRVQSRFLGAASGPLGAAAQLIRERAGVVGPRLAGRAFRAQDSLRGQVGEQALERLTVAQQAVLIDLQDAVGRLPDELAEAVRNGVRDGSNEGISEALAEGAGPQVRANLSQPQIGFAQDAFSVPGQDDAAAIARERELRDLAQERLDRISEARSEYQEIVTDLSQQIVFQQLTNQGLDREVAILEAIRQAKATGVELSEHDLAVLRERAGLLFDLQQPVETASDPRESLREILANLQQQLALQTLRNAGLDREAAISQVIQQARAADVALSREDLALLRERAGLLFDLQQTQAGEILDDIQHQIDLQHLVNDGLEREAAIEQAVHQIRESGVVLSQQDLATLRERTGLLFDLRQQTEEQAAADARVNELLMLRSALEQELAALRERGADPARQQSLVAGIQNLNLEIDIAIDSALEILEAMENWTPAIEAAISRLRTLRTENQAAAGGIRIAWADVENQLGTRLAGAFDTFAMSLAMGESIASSLRNAFRSFASQFLLDIARMISQQIAFNIAASIIGGIGGAAGGFIPFFHAGTDFVSRGAGQRRALPSRGGLGPDEVLSVLQVGEQVIPAGGNAGQGQGGTTIVNAFDASSFLEESLRDRGGQDTVLNFVQARRGAFRSALGIT